MVTISDVASATSVAFLGTGNIAGPYAESIARHPELEVVGCFDVDAAKRAAFAAEHGLSDYGSLDELCAADPDIVLNLTAAPFHHATTRELLERRRNVFSEKPLALDPGQAAELADLADRQGVRLACAPSIWLGAAQLAAARAVLAGAAGTVGLITAEVNQGRIESWHPAPDSFFRVGPVVDAGIYPLTYLTAVLGPIREVTAMSRMALPERRRVDGTAFRPEVDDVWIIAARFASGPILRLSCNFYANPEVNPRAVVVNGDDATVRLDDWLLPGAAVRIAPYGEGYRDLEPASDRELDWALGLVDLARAMRTGTAHRNDARHAAHITEVFSAIAESARTGNAVGVESEFPAPADFGA